MGIFSFITKGENKKNIKGLENIANAVITLEDKYKAMTDSELKSQTAILQGRLESETLDDIMVDAFAVIREASARVLQMRHYKVQLMGGACLHQGRVAEMKTGEGKTLVETLPAYLNALTGKGVHVITVNDYLAHRDAMWMGKVYQFLGLTVGVNISGMTEEEKKIAYDCDITYGTNNEFGFDYLRDNLKTSKAKKVQRDHAFAIVDEVDSILIDEARTPLIISGQGEKSSNLYAKINSLVCSFSADDFEFDEKEKSINMTEAGVIKAEKYLKIDDLSDIENKDIHKHIQSALKAHHIFKRDNNYIVSDGEVIIVDEFTGRLMIGRRYSEGLHQAIEAKEGVVIKSENKTFATITFQNYFRIYDKLSGMTGTAKTEEEEFRGIYSLDVVEIPTNIPSQRVDKNDLIYPTEAGKLRAVCAEIAIAHQSGQPILVGTVTVEKSELVSSMLKRLNVPHNVLNAKNHAREAEIIAQAGRFGAVTIATNMAGRGTDILLGGNPAFMARTTLLDEGIDEERIDKATSYETQNDEEIIALKAKYDSLYKNAKEICDSEKEKVLQAGGLYIIGTERHESRRIDNQLRGRSGRQGDRGASIFYISLEDDLARRFGGESMQRMYDKLKIDEDTPITLGLLTKQIENAQKVIEGKNFGIRKNVLEYDDVMNTQREIMYGERNKVLDGESVHEQILKMLPDFVAEVIHDVIPRKLQKADWDFEKINKDLEAKLLPKDSNFLIPEVVDGWDNDFLASQILQKTIDEYNAKIEKYSEINLNFEEIERVIMLKCVDKIWMDHIDQMDILRRGISLRAYGGVDPIMSYKKEAFDMFEEMTARIQEDTVKTLLKTEFKIVPKIVHKEVMTVEGGTNEAREKRKAASVGRNEPCPCGSGRKYKNCCGK
ncbi:MAG: preprotein translocase subunit SecA [Bacillota bacterium]